MGISAARGTGQLKHTPTAQLHRGVLTAAFLVQAAFEVREEFMSGAGSDGSGGDQQRPQTQPPHHCSHVGGAAHAHARWAAGATRQHQRGDGGGLEWGRVG